MARLHPPLEPVGGQQVVAPPRITDAIGQALRGAYDRPTTLPDEMRAALEQLDRARRAAAH